MAFSSKFSCVYTCLYWFATKENYMQNQHLCELNCVSRFLLDMAKSRVGAWQRLCKISQLSRGVSSDDENTGQESGVLISTEFSLLSSCCFKIFFFSSIKLLYSNAGGTCFPAENNGQTRSILTFSLVITGMAGWRQPLWYENWHRVTQDICGEERQQEDIVLINTWRRTVWVNL